MYARLRENWNQPLCKWGFFVCEKGEKKRRSFSSPKSLKKAFFTFEDERSFKWRKLVTCSWNDEIRISGHQDNWKISTNMDDINQLKWCKTVRMIATNVDDINQCRFYQPMWMITNNMNDINNRGSYQPICTEPFLFCDLTSGKEFSHLSRQKGKRKEKKNM